MDWQTVDALAEIDGQIARLHDDQVAHQHLLEEAVINEMRFEDGAELARSVQARCRQRIRWDAEEQDRLRQERTAIVPEQRSS